MAFINFSKMDLDAKIRKVHRDIEDYGNKFALSDGPGRWNFLRVISNRKRLFSDNSISDVDFYKKFIYHKRMTEIESHYAPEMFENGLVEIDGIERLGPAKDTIFVSFHFGSFMTIAYFLTLNNVKVALLVSNSSFSFSEKYREVWKTYGIDEELKVFNADNKKDFIEAIRFMQNEGSLYTLMDGGAGSSNLNTTFKINETYSLNVRNGLSKLSMKFKKNLQLIISERYESCLKWKLRIEKVVSPEEAETSTAELWRLAWGVLSDKPYQWENLQYSFSSLNYEYHKSADTTIPIEKSGGIKFNKDLYYLIKHEDQHFLFDVRDSQLKAVSSELFGFLDKCNEHNLELDRESFEYFVRSENTRSQLLTNQVLC